MPAATPPALDRRALNRATLHRQLLLERSTTDPLSAVEHLAGLQAQAPFSPYYQLWSRLADFDSEALAGHLLERRVVRTVAMRGTVHLMTADDGLALPPLVQPVIDRDLYGNKDRANSLRGLDTDAFTQAARELLGDQALTNSEIGAQLTERFPDIEPSSLAYAARCLLSLVQVPPRAVWGHSGQPRWKTIESWLGRPDRPTLDIDTLFLRYLRAFGPASVADAQTWSGLRRLSEVAERLRPRLAVFRDETGRELFDLPEAIRPDPDIPAPVRLLPDFDNLIRSHADRSRFVDPDDMKILNTRNGVTPNSVLIDGRVAGTWRIEKASGEVRLDVRPFRRISAGTLDAVVDEGARLLTFAHPGMTDPAVEVLPL